MGLGNPGPRYALTRHNAGFLTIDELARRTRASGRLAGDAWVGEAQLAGETLLLVKPLSYMNLSGGPVARLAAERGAAPADLVVVVDDVALPLGRIRVRPGGSDGGHNGLRSLVLSLGTEEFARVRIGVGVDPPPAQDLADFVLGEFLEEERPRLREAVGVAADAVACLVEAGTAVAMNRFNGPRV